MNQSEYINEYFHFRQVAAERMDELWANGWRHFGDYFFRYSLGFSDFEIQKVIPLRIRLADFTFSKSQRRILKRNSDLNVIVRPIEITTEKEELFDRHKQRFEQGKPESLYTFLSTEPAIVPCDGLEFCVYELGKLVAVSFLGIGAESVSAIYAMFEPSLAKRGLGIFTMLLEIQFARANKKTFYYQGYCYEGQSFYDYKKRFRAIEKFDWRGSWDPWNDPG